MDFHILKVDEVLKKLKTSEQGLSDAQFNKRFSKHGPNSLPSPKKVSKWRIVFTQFKSPLIYILAFSGIITLFLGDYTDAIVIWLAVLVNTIVGYIQEKKANDSLSALNKIVKNRVVVRRNGGEHEIDQENLTIGDIVLLRSGDKVPADGRVILSNDLKINESALTGEWLAVEKKVESLKQETFFSDRTNMAYMGTLIESGVGEMVVTAIARDTEFGRIAKLIKETGDEVTPYQERLARFSKILGSIIVAVCLFIFIEGMLSGGSFAEMFITAIAVAVAAIPEGLPMAMTVILAIGMQRILKKNGLVRRLSSAETLGSTSVICTDKTGTLTEGKMEVENIILIDGNEAKFYEAQTAPVHLQGSRDKMYKIITLLAEAFIENPKDNINNWVLRGRPTDKALLKAGHKAGFDKDQLLKYHHLLARVPFNSAQKFSATLYQTSANTREILMMGAPEVVLDSCDKVVVNGKETQLTLTRQKNLRKKVSELAGNGLRVMGIAYQAETAKSKNKFFLNELNNNDVSGMVFLGFVTLKDPLRANAKHTIAIAQQAGLRPVIITGDHKLTVQAVANELGLRVGEKNIIEGKDIDKMTDKELRSRVRDIIVYARVMPQQKLRIISAWQSLGKVVAMTGDGINDAPALKKADVGIALGSGTTVAKEVSDLVLLSDDFSIIIAAIEEGRGIIDNIRKVITYLLASSFSEIILVSAAIFFGWPLPVLAVQILWVNLIEDGFPNFALAFEPKENDIMKRKPMSRKEPLLTREMKIIIFVTGIFTDFILLGLFYYLFNYAGYELAHARSFIFAGLAIDSRFYVYSCKSLRKNIWQINLLNNKFLLLSTLISTTALLAVFYLPVLQILFKTVALSWYDWGLLVGLAIFKLGLIELTKWRFISRKLA